jgi:signal transduction histidine kinase
VRVLLGGALLAIVLSAAVLAVLGYVSLRQWEASAELLFREQARDMAIMAVEKAETVLRRAEEEALDQVAAAVGARGFAPGTLEGLRQGIPLIRELYLVDRRAGLLFPPAGAGPAGGLVADLLAEIPDGLWERGGRRHLVTGDRVVLVSVVRTGSGPPYLVAMVHDPEVLRRDVLGPALASLERTTAVAVLDHHDRPVYRQRTAAGADRLATVAFGEALPSWRVALYRASDAAPLAAVERQIRIFSAAFVLLLLVIVAGLVATYRLVRRETEMARLKADFVANVSHDLKTPLSLIRMFGETLEMGRVRDDAARQEYYRVITRESERLSRLIDNVLDFSRIEGGHRRYERVPTPVEPLVRETLEAFGYPLAQQGFRVEVQVAPDLPEVPMDADAVGQALANLVDNAIKYSAERKALRVEATLRDGELALTVADEGIGIPREAQQRIFEKFYRVGRSETQGRRGSGVGLALVRHVAEAHGGRVTVESQPGAGSRFTLWLPVGAPPASAEHGWPAS